MNTVTPFKIAMVFTSDTAAAKAGVTDLATGMRQVGTEATKAGAAAQKGAADLDELASSAARAALAHDDLAAAERRAAARPAQASPLQVLASPASPAPIAPIAPIVASFRATETAADSLRSSLAGVSATVGDQAHEMVAAAQSAAAYRAALDDIRASYNPIFAASLQYERQLERIAEAERLGAINAREAAAARTAAAAKLGPTGPISPGASNGSAYTSNVAAQGFDIGVTAAMGMNPMMIGLQQGTQIAQVAQQMGGGTQALKGIAAGFMSILSPMTLATIGLTAFAAFGIQGLMKLRGETKSFADSVEDMVARLDAVVAANDKARRSVADLRAEFGSSALAGRAYYDEIADLERQMATLKVNAAMGAVRGDHEEGFASLHGLLGPFSTPQFRKVFDIRQGDMEGTRKAAAVQVAARDLDAAEGLDAQAEALERLLVLYREAAQHAGEISEKNNAGLQNILTALTAVRRLQAQDENAAGIAQAEAMRVSLAQQIQLERTSLVHGEDSAEMRALQARHEREAAVAKLDGLRIDLDSVEARRVLNGLLELQYYREQAAAEARREWFTGQDDQLAAVQREIMLIGASAAEQTRVNALAQAELDIRNRKLTVLEAAVARVNAIARAEAEILRDRQRALRDLQVQAQMDGYDERVSAARNPYIRAEIEGERAFAREMASTGDATVAAAAAMQARARAIREADQAQTDFLRGQAESLQQMQLEIALIGQSAEVRSRVLALAKAEQDIQRLGASGREAEMIREGAVAHAEMARQLDEQVDAWRRVQSAGEQAIDGVLDALRGGDVTDAFAALLGEIEAGFFDLAVRNPLKNALLGTNLGTFDDVGGLGGIWGRLSGRQPVDEAGLVGAASMPVQTMAVNAATVVLSGNLAGLGAAGVANLSMPPITAAGGGLSGSKDVQAQIWAFFSAKGLPPHQIAGIMGNVSAESAFNPLARGDNGQAFGLFQHNDRKQNLFDFIGGQQNLGDVQKQLEFAWHELMTTEIASYRRLLNSGDVRQATEAFVGFERPQGYTVQNPSGAMHFDRRLAAAEAAMGQFETTTIAAQQQLGQLGTGAAQLGSGLQGFGSSIAGVIQNAGAQHGVGGMLVSGLLGGLGQMASIPGFDRGGWTGPGAANDVAGVVHAGEFVFDAAATSRIGVRQLETIRSGGMRGYRDGGYVTGGRAAAAFSPMQSASQPSASRERVIFQIHVTGTGNSEVHQNTLSAIGEALGAYDQHVLGDRVRTIVNDKWGTS